jgi:pimeloyl-ACP methyl ester carboxylesterase/uncharacterized protein YjbI with pentapeptide repeats
VISRSWAWPILLGSAISCAPPRACRTADLGGRAVYHCLAGRGEVTVILESDAGVDHTVWDSLAARIAPFARVLTYDRLGLGRSDSTATRRDPGTVAAELDTLLRTVGITGDLVLVGHGKGGWHLRSFAELHPDGIRRLILIDSPHEDFESRVRASLPAAQLPQLDSAVAARRASLAPGARREHDDLNGARPATAIRVPVTTVRGTRPQPTIVPAAEPLWRTLHDSLARSVFDAEVVGAGPVIRLDRPPDTLVAIINEEAAGPESWLRQALPKLAAVAGTVLLLALGAMLAPLGQVPGRIRKWWEQTHPDPDSIWSLIDSSTPARGRAVALLQAINQGAVERASERLGATDRGRASDSKAARIWDPLFSEFWAAQRAFVQPGCRIFERGRLQGTTDGVAAVRRWLAAGRPDSHARSGANANGPTAVHVHISGAGGSGKTTFVHRLFLELIGAIGTEPSGSAPVPMLASARNLQTRAERIAKLQQDADSLSAFVSVWLENRLGESDDIRQELIEDFSRALRDGEIVLLVDGLDELRHQGLGRFAENLLGEVRVWVASHRPDGDGGTSEWSIAVDDAWTIDRIGAHLEKRWPDRREAGARVTAAIRSVLERHRPVGAQEHHWLRQPLNLDLFLQDLESGELPDEAELHSRAESQPYLFGKILNRAISRIAGASGNAVAIRNRLFEVAVNDPTDTRRDAGVVSQVRLDDATGEQVSALGELLASSAEGLYFRHAALREYFVAGRIAWELHDTVRRAGPGDELLAEDDWTAPKRAAVGSWLYELGGDPIAQVCARLSRTGVPGARLGPNARRNLLDLLIRLELERSGGKRRQIRLSNLDLRGVAGGRLDLHRIEIDHCTFEGATLDGAELSSATFRQCDFRRAELANADAFGTVFEQCRFGSGGADWAVVDGMAIEGAKFTENGTQAADIQQALVGRGALLKRSRYSGEFGERFFKAQKAFLGAGLEELEDHGYIPAIEAAVRERELAIDGPVYLVDLMAGGRYENVVALRGRFQRLHILGIDRDPSTRPSDPRFRWACVEIGADASGGDSRLTLDIGTLLKASFGSDAGCADVIVAKKALHEIDRALQPLLIRECAESLRPGGRLILFVDAPGPSEGPIDREQLATVHDELGRLRRILTDDAYEPAEVAREIIGRWHDATPIGQMGFVNAWIMVKDWANLNRHEVRHRYFASVAEVREWAEPWFGAPVSVIAGQYRLNPRTFNELGIQRVLHHLARDGGDPHDAVARDLSMLSRWTSGGERFRVLLDFTRRSLAPGTKLAEAVGMRPGAVALESIAPALERLNSCETTPEFGLSCAVLVFEKPVPSAPVSRADEKEAEGVT